MNQQSNTSSLIHKDLEDYLNYSLDKAYNLGVQACIDTLINTPLTTAEEVPTFKENLYHKLNNLKKKP